MRRRGRGRGVCGQRCGRKREVLVCWVHHLSFLFRPASFLFWGAGSPSCSCSSVGIALRVCVSEETRERRAGEG